MGGTRRAALHALLFVLDFSLVFVTLGATLRCSLPLLQQIAGWCAMMRARQPTRRTALFLLVFELIEEVST